MGTLKLSNSSGNFIALDAPSSISADKTFTLPNADGSSGQVIQTNGSGVLSFVDQTTDTDTNGFTDLSTVSLSGNSSVTITGIPTTANIIYVNVHSVSTGTNSASRLQIRLGNGSVDTNNNYAYNAVYIGSSVASEGSASTDQMRLFHGDISGASHLHDGTAKLIRTKDQGWLMTAAFGQQASAGYFLLSAGRYNQDTGIDRIELFTAGSNNWDDGSVCVSYSS